MGYDGPRKVKSPSPQARHISKTRVNMDERSSLLSKDADRNDLQSFRGTPLKPQESGIGRGGRMDGDLDSIDWRSCLSYEGENHHHSSVISAGFEGDPSLYFPSQTNDIEDLEWKTLLPYYLPFLSWVPLYSLSYFLGDLIGGLSLVFFQLPLSLSYASSLAHVPVTCGLYSLALAPLIYLVFGSVPQMIVGPEAAILLVVGQAIEPFLHHHGKYKDVDIISIVSVITFISGCTLFGFGLGRFGFLDNVLNGSLLKGFIAGVGVVMIIDSLIVTMGLTKLLDKVTNDPEDMDIHSPVDKFRFLIHNYKRYDPLTFKISLSAIIMIFAIRFLKKRLQRTGLRYSSKFIYVPEILIVFLTYISLCAKYKWNEQGVAIIGTVRNNDSSPLFRNPVSSTNWQYIKPLSTSGFLCAMLGFFESTTALKSLGSEYDLPISPNRELIALGSMNILGSLVGALPAFGGYGRSKINALSAKTTMLGGIMAVCTIFIISFLLGGLYYVPKCILSVITATIGILLIEEAPKEFLFHYKSAGYDELITFFIVVTTTLFFSMEAGVSVGLIYLLIRVIKKSAKSRIQILGRIPGSNTFVNADITQYAIKDDSLPYNMNRRFSLMLHKHHLHGVNLFVDDNFSHLNTSIIEEIEGCLIIKVPEPLTFVNASDLKSRLKRMELFGSTKAHPGLRRSRAADMTKYVIFDLEGMVEIDSSAAQILYELLANYHSRGIFSFFVRVAPIVNLRRRLRNTGITDLLENDLDQMKNDAHLFGVSTNSSASSSKVIQGTHHNDIGQSKISREINDMVYSLTESPDSPYFNHIRSALQLIDAYELDSTSGSRV